MKNLPLTLATLWARRYRVPHYPFDVRTEDGIRIAGVHLNRKRTSTLVIYAHGFMSNKNHLRVPGFVEAMSQYFDVMAIDLRGHGESEGYSTIGTHEVLDIQATVAYGRSLGYKRIVTVGSSMGGSSMIRHAALYKSQDAVITIGAFADPISFGRPFSDDGLRLVYKAGKLGEWWCYMMRGTRLRTAYYTLHEQDPPFQLVERIAPKPLLIIHGEWDVTVHPRSAKQLYAYAKEPKEIVLLPYTGHDYPHLTAKMAHRLYEWIVRHGLHQ